MTKHTLSVIVAVLVVISVLFLNRPTHAKEPFAKEDNPGVPGFLAKVDQLNKIILELQQQIVQKDEEITGLHQEIAQMNLELWDLQIRSNGRQTQALVAQTGQTNCFDPDGFEIPCDGTGQDGENQGGVPWPAPRFTDNLNGTVTDNLTGLIWTNEVESRKGWADALGLCNGLADGSYDLSDGSVAGDWRLPNVKELQSLVDYQNFVPTLPDAEGTGTAFFNVGSSSYWTSTNRASDTSFAWYVNFADGYVSYSRKSFLKDVWCVRGE